MNIIQIQCKQEASETRVQSRSQVSLECGADGDDPISVVWRREGRWVREEVGCETVSLQTAGSQAWSLLSHCHQVRVQLSFQISLQSSKYPHKSPNSHNTLDILKTLHISSQPFLYPHNPRLGRGAVQGHVLQHEHCPGICAITCSIEWRTLF